MSAAPWEWQGQEDPEAAALADELAGGSDLADWTPPIDWAAFWAQDSPEQDWLIEPIVPAGRQVAVFSRAKTGKSLLALDVAAALATGAPILGLRPVQPATTVYIDLEMTDADLRERLEDLGYGPESDLSRLVYYQLPSLPPLDTELGGQVLQAIVDRHHAALVVIDTMARAVTGDENNADTYRDFYRHAGRRLKAQGVALLRLDHAGKDPALGQRGSSAKADDLDVVFSMTAEGDEGFRLTRTHSRVPWVPPKVELIRHTEPLRHVLTSGLWPESTKEVAALLDELHVPLDVTYHHANQSLRDAGQGRRKHVVLAALKWRREQA